MIDINEQVREALLETGERVVYQHPQDFSVLPVISYYNVSESGAFFADNCEYIEEGVIEADVWAKVPSDCAKLSHKVEDAMRQHGWMREISKDVPKNNDKVYRRTMKFRKYFTL